MDKVWLSWSHTVCVHLVNLVKKKVMQTGNGQCLPSEWKLCFTTTAKMFQSFTLMAIVVTLFLVSAPLGKFFLVMQVSVFNANYEWPQQSAVNQSNCKEIFGATLCRGFSCTHCSRAACHIGCDTTSDWLLWLLATVTCSLSYDQRLHDGRRPVSRAW